MGDEGGQHHGLFDGLQGIGFLNALRTGDPRVDMVVALIFPFVVMQARDWFQEFVTWVRRWFEIKTSYEERTINHMAHKTSWGGSYSDNDTQNTILLKAIQLYLHAKLKLNLSEAEVDLTSTEDKNSSVGRGNNYYYDSDDDDDGDDGKTLVGALSKYRIVQKPPPGQWIDLGEFGGTTSDRQQENETTKDGDKNDDGGNDEHARCAVRLRIERDEQSKGNDGSRTTIVTCFRFQAENGKAIDAFIQQAYDWYMSELRKMEDHARYLYELKPVSGTKTSNNDGDDDGGHDGRSYTRYKLSDEKTFDSLFFSQKEGLLKILDHFQERSGKYSIKGYPHKLGLLLHGYVFALSAGDTRV